MESKDMNSTVLLKKVYRRLRTKPKRAKLSQQFPERLTPELARLLEIVQPYTMVDPLRLWMLYKLTREVSSKCEGDIVECGVCNGGSAAVLAAAIRDNSRSKLWLYDTFEGIPAPIEKDGPVAQKYSGAFKGSLVSVEKILKQVGFPLERLILRKGLFQDTFQEPRPEKISMLHLDGDWYESVILCLRTFYHSVSASGVIVLDDFGYWEGAREAFYDFCHENSVKPLLERVGCTQAFWRKGQEHTRSSCDRYPSGMYQPNEHISNNRHQAS